jgi:ketosteroid isomerase-like protein
VSAAENRAVIERLYDALDRGDGETMGACYAPDARFRDPAFGELNGEQIGGMWRMLTSRATDLDVELRSHDADEERGSANWVATYTFTATGRSVLNDIQARFRFRDGLIVEHYDEFSFRRWASQAFGPAGNAIALLPPLRMRARRTAAKQLADYLAEES